eukprot:Partr_v1_DN23079_c0_g1_i1_m26996 putative ran binding protein
MFRFDKDTSEWKERGTGDVKMLQHKQSKKVRVLMRREKTLKICANHILNSDMKLKPNLGSDRSWVYNVVADLVDDEVKQELLAIRFANAENANKFKAKFEECQKVNQAVIDGGDIPELEVLAVEDKEEPKEEKKEEEKKEAAK